MKMALNNFHNKYILRTSGPGCGEPFPAGGRPPPPKADSMVFKKSLKTMKIRMFYFKVLSTPQNKVPSLFENGHF